MRPRPGDIVLVETGRRDGLPALRQGRLCAVADGLVGVELRRGTLSELIAPIGATVSLRPAGHPNSAEARVIASFAGRDGLVLSVAASPTIDDRRQHRRTLVTRASVEAAGESIAVTDVGPGGLRLATPAATAVRRVRLHLGGEPRDLEVVASDHPARLRFARTVSALGADRVVPLLTLAT